MIIKAINFAAEKHRNQERKTSGLPYVTHPIIVSHLLFKYKGSSKNIDQLMCAAILHDTLEDTNTDFIEIASTFTPMIAGLVLELTSDTKQIQLLGKNEYLKKKLSGMSSYALVIKLVDRLSNILDNPTDKYKIDTLDLIEFITKNRKLSKTQLKICTEINNTLKETI